VWERNPNILDYGEHLLIDLPVPVERVLVEGCRRGDVVAQSAPGGGMHNGRRHSSKRAKSRERLTITGTSYPLIPPGTRRQVLAASPCREGQGPK
jgi:hypothetical protein